MTNQTPSPRASSTFRTFFFRGLGILLPTILTIYILFIVFQFVDTNIAKPINKGIKAATVRIAQWPNPKQEDFEFVAKQLADRSIESSGRVRKWEELEAEIRRGFRGARANTSDVEARLEIERLIFVREAMQTEARQRRLEMIWNRYTIGTWRVLDILGLLVAIILIYIAGRVLGSLIGRKIYRRVEAWLRRLPLFKQVFPYVKQVTDFIVGDSTGKLQFNRVVAVEYPRKGLWSVGLVTGDTMRTISEHTGKKYITVFIPSSPTPFTGYVITVASDETITLPITIDEALRFTVSGGVILPPGEEPNVVSSKGEPTSQLEKESPVHSNPSG